MKFALVLGLAFFCSLWTGGLLLKCSSCVSTVSYEDCQNNLTVINCSTNQKCFQVEARSVNGSDVEVLVQKGCLNEEDCAAYRQGDNSYCNGKRSDNYTVDCKGECCSNGDECNKESLLNPDLPLMCSSCSSSVSYEDCQKKLTVVNCTDPNEVCYQADTKYEREGEVTITIKKGCLKKDFCNAYSKGDIGECKTKEAQGYSVDCNAKCCSDGNKCNEENLLPNQGPAFVISVMVLLLSVLLTLVSVN